MSHSTPGAAPDRRRLWILVAVVAVAVLVIGGWLVFGRGGSTGGEANVRGDVSPATPVPGAPATGSGDSAYATKGACPDELPVKVTDNPRYYYEPSNPKYSTIKADYCYKTVELAVANSSATAPQ